MKGFAGILKRAVALAMLLALLAGMTTVALADETTSITKEDKTYEIAVAFDNSGSMYGSEAWCRAKYAMEIFASMLDYDKGDRLVVFPMWEVLTDGTQYGTGSYAPVKITSKKDIDKIHNLFTVHAGQTPFAPVTEAFQYLQTVSGKERWLIVLTDGAFNQRERDEFEGIDIQSELDLLAGGQINIQYLGFGGARDVKDNPSKGLYSVKSTESSLQKDLVNICNRIFRRAELPSSYLSGTNLTLDLSMGKLIVFVQGKNAQIDSLTDANGREIRKLMDSGRRTYSELRSGSDPYAPVDYNLAGQVVTFASCTAGDFTLSYSGADNIQIFYEPDVDLSTQFLNADGTVVDTSGGEVVSGEYMVRYGLIDRVTGKDVTNHQLLEVQNFGCDVIVDGTRRIPVKNGETITLEPETEISFEYSGTFLEDYTISSSDSAKAMKLKVTLPLADAFSAELTADQRWFVKRTYDQWQPLRADFALNGQALTDDQLKSLSAAFTAEPDLPLKVEWLPGESACLIHVSRDDAGQFVDCATGRFNVEVKGSFTDEFGRELPFSDSVVITIEEKEAIIVILTWILIALAIIAALVVLYILVGLIKKLPKRVQIEIVDGKGKKIGKNTIRLMKKGTTIFVKDRFSARAVVPETGFHKQGSPNATFMIKGMTINGKVTSISIAGRTYSRNRHKVLVAPNGTEVNPETFEISVYDGMKISWTAVDSSNKKFSFVGEILINRK